MKNIKTYISLTAIFIVLTSITGFTQSIDETRMNRDIEVAEDILESLVTEDDHYFPFRAEQIEGSYVADFGAVFTMPPAGIRVFPGGVSIGQSSGGAYVISTNKSRKEGTNDEEGVVDLFKIFLVDYGDLIGQIQPNEKIMVTSQSEERNNFGFYYNYKNKTKWKKNNHYDSDDEPDQDDEDCDCEEETNGQGLSAEIMKSTLNDYKQGKITREQAFSKVKITKNEATDKNERDLELFSSIFERLYDSDLSSTYYAARNIHYDRLQNFGVVYNMRVYSSNQDGDGYFMPTLNIGGLSEQERKDKVKELYPQFVKELKENMVEYGRTLKSLSPDEILMIKVKMTQCDNCGLPETLEFSIKASELTSYSQGKISKDRATSKVSVKKG